MLFTYISAINVVNNVNDFNPFMSSFASWNIDVVKVDNIEKKTSDSCQMKIVNLKNEISKSLDLWMFRMHLLQDSIRSQKSLQNDARTDDHESLSWLIDDLLKGTFSN